MQVQNPKQHILIMYYISTYYDTKPSPDTRFKLLNTYNYYNIQIVILIKWRGWFKLLNLIRRTTINNNDASGKKLYICRL